MMLYRPLTDRSKLPPESSVITNVLSTGNRLKNDYQAKEAEARSTLDRTASAMRELFDYRNVWPYLVHDASAALASADPQQVLLARLQAPVRQAQGRQPVWPLQAQAPQPSVRQPELPELPER